MSTQSIFKLILNKLSFTSYSLAKRLDISHTTFKRYLSGANEAPFADLMIWLKSLHIHINGNELFISSIPWKPLNKLDRNFVSAIYNSLEDGETWKKEGDRIELDEGHVVTWLDRPWR